jgi:rifampicin phosphotransferase
MKLVAVFLETGVGKVVVWLSRKLAVSGGDRIGPKAVGLCMLSRLGMKVPPCFFVTTGAFREHLDCDGLRSRIGSLLDGLDARPDGTQGVLEEIRQLILRTPLSGVLREQVAAAYGRLRAPVAAVRSSATAEDLPGHSFAGQYETILGVRSREECFDAIRKCWASLWTERAFEYRRRNGIDHRQVEMAVIVQQQIEPDAAGVAFSVDPVTGSPSRIVIESCRGLGEALVSGNVQPDRFLLQKRNLELIRQNLVADKPSLDLKSAQRLARHVRRIEKRLGSPQDVEWAIRDGTIWFLQARPITALPEPKPWEDRQVWTNLNLGEIVPDVMTPMTRSIVVPMFVPLFHSLFRLLGADPAKGQVVGFVAGRLYFNINVGLAAVRPFISPVKAAALNSTFGGHQNQSYELGEFDIGEEDLPDLGFSWPRYILSWPGIVRTLIAHRPSRAEAFKAAMHAQSDALSRVDVTSMPTEELVGVVGRILRKSLNGMDLLYLGPGVVALGVLQKACRDWLGDEDRILTYRLFAAQGGIADTQAGLDLWRLAALLHRDREMEALVLSNESCEGLHTRLQWTEHGREFLATWNRFMTEHGHHCRGEIELLNPRWSERPDYILDLLRGYLRSIDRTDPLANQERLAREREQLTAECRRRLRNPIKRAIFDWAIQGSRRVAVERENWKNEFICHIAVFRRVLLELGERLRKQGILKSRDDIFFLEITELEPVIAGAADSDITEWIAERRAQYKSNTKLTPPPVVVGRYDPETHRPLEIDTTAKMLKGIAVSPGIVTGKAKVILHADDHEHIEAGEILVAPFTDPAWTPYFLPAAGVVMDLGGVLSHGAIIAREYGIPTVVNVGHASKIVQTGQMLRVDGDRGIVTILDPESPPDAV